MICDKDVLNGRAACPQAAVRVVFAVLCCLAAAGCTEQFAKKEGPKYRLAPISRTDIVKTVEEVLFIRNVVLDSLFDANLFFKLINLIEELIECIHIVFAAYTDEVCTLNISFKSLWILIL